MLAFLRKLAFYLSVLSREQPLYEIYKEAGVINKEKRKSIPKYPKLDRCIAIPMACHPPISWLHMKPIKLHNNSPYHYLILLSTTLVRIETKATTPSCFSFLINPKPIKLVLDTMWPPRLSYARILTAGRMRRYTNSVLDSASLHLPIYL